MADLITIEREYNNRGGEGGEEPLFKKRLIASHHIASQSLPVAFQQLQSSEVPVDEEGFAHQNRLQRLLSVPSKRWLR